MRIHSNTLTQNDLTIAVNLAGAWFIKRTEHKSRKRSHAFEVALSGDAAHRSQADRDEYGATWDQWGIFLAALFDRDPSMVTPDYRDAADFHFQTHERFRDGLPLSERHRQHRWDHAGLYRNTRGEDVTFFVCRGSRGFGCDAETHRIITRRG